ncbi:MAG: ABC transporter permease [Clostridiaceae bacterium]|jgi:ribose/xylose/arabinose/galactoside ABC-type transport system permease subunit|nr:ABC transporter permease [Clostridiaceae bacterium]
MKDGIIFLKKRMDNVLLFGMLFITVFTITIVRRDFLTAGTLQSMAFQLPEMGLLTISMMITMITGGINLSCIASANLSGIIMATIMTTYITPGNDNVAVVLFAIILGMLISILVGLANGAVIAFFRVPAILATLGMQMLINGICLVMTKGKIISGYPKSFRYIGNGDIAGIPVPLIIFLCCALIMAFILRKTPVGSRAYMYGSNVTATEFSGVNTKAMLLKVYAISGFFVGIASIVLTSRFNSASAGYAESYLLLAVLIAVLGGISPNGGKGGVLGMVLSVVILQVVSSGLNLLTVSQHLTTALWGIILILAVAVRSYKRE